MLLKQGIAPHEHVGLLIGAARRRITQALGRRLRHHRLTPRQFWILVAIDEHPGFSLTELAKYLRMDFPTASRVVVALERRKLVEVREDSADGRRSRLFLGTVGQRLGDELHEIAAAVRGAVTHGLSASDRERLRVLLRRIITNMDRFDGGKPLALALRTVRS